MFDLSSFGLVLQEPIDGPWDTAARQSRTVLVPGLSGPKRVSPDDVLSPLQAKCNGTIVSTSRAGLIANLDGLKSYLSDGLLTVIWADRLTVERYMRLMGSVSVGPVSPKYESLTARVAFTLQTDEDPFGHETLPIIAKFGAVRAAMPCGTAAVAPRTLLANATGGAISNIIGIYRNAGGDPIYQFTWSGSLLAGETLDIEHLLMQVNKISTAGARTSVRNLFTGPYVTIRPGDGNQPAAVYPTLEATATGGAVSGLALYNRAFL